MCPLQDSLDRGIPWTECDEGHTAIPPVAFVGFITGPTARHLRDHARSYQMQSSANTSSLSVSPHDGDFPAARRLETRLHTIIVCESGRMLPHSNLGTFEKLSSCNKDIMFAVSPSPQHVLFVFFVSHLVFSSSCSCFRPISPQWRPCWRSIRSTAVYISLTPRVRVSRQTRPQADREFFRDQVHFSTLAQPLPHPGK